MDNHNSRSNIQAIAEELLGLVYDEMDEGERRVLEGIAKRHAISRDLADSWTTEATFGQRIADRVAAFGGSWTFIILFFALIAGWVLINTAFILRDPVPDPYPFILLNLILSMLAAFQAPVIMMSQNRQAEKDRQAAANDYEVNLKAELEILRLHEKIDALRDLHLQMVLARLEARIDAAFGQQNPATGHSATATPQSAIAPGQNPEPGG